MGVFYAMNIGDIILEIPVNTSRYRDVIEGVEEGLDRHCRYMHAQIVARCVWPWFKPIPRFRDVLAHWGWL